MMKEIKGISRSELIKNAATELAKVKDIQAPEWVSYSKSGVHKARPVVQKDFWQMRSAAMLVKIERIGPIGVSKLRTLYGGRKRRGHQPAEFRKGSGSVARKVLQQLEKAGLVRQTEKGLHKGRIITPAGAKLLTRAAKAKNG
jgi:small subunit ribosomal protein S19e